MSKHTWCSSNLGARLLWRQPAFEVSLQGQKCSEENWLEEKKRSLPIWTKNLTYRPLFVCLLVFPLKNEDLGFRLYPSVTLIVIHNVLQ